jgi:hypothetical protein
VAVQLQQQLEQARQVEQVFGDLLVEQQTAVQVAAGQEY